jgi:hypothetical protein
MAKQPNKTAQADNACFVIMPISDGDEYEDGHFSKVYEDIFKPACINAGFTAIRTDEVKQTNLIHLDILQKLIDSPMAICDLSSRNPNVLFELGLRQAFDKPTVLVQEVGTARIFDIAPLRYTEYRKELKYREVLEDQNLIAEAVTATKEANKNGEGFNSLVNILSLAGPASLKEVNESDSSRMLQLVRAEMSEMRSDFRRTMHSLEVYREKEFIRRPPSANVSHRLREVRDHMRKADYLLEDGAPKEIVIKEINRAQEHLIRILDGDLPMKYLEEAKQMFTHTEKMEKMLVHRDE